MTRLRNAATLFLLAVPCAPGLAAPPAYESSAPIAYLYDMASGAVLFAKNDRRRIPPASMAKMMTSHLAFRLIDRGELTLDRKIAVKRDTWEKWHGPKAGSTMFLKAGEQVSVENLLNGVITLSGNDACVVLAEGIAGSETAFVAKMNDEAKRLGMADTRFGTSNGWPDQGATYSTARDLATLGMATIRDHPQFYRKFYGLRTFTWGTQVKGGAISQPNRNPILGRVAGADGIKTGHTAEAGYGFAGSAIQNGRRLVMVVAGLPSFDARVAESVRLMNWGFSAWTAKPLYPKGKIVGEARVQMGNAGAIPLVTADAVMVTLPANASQTAYSTSIAYDGPLKPPIARGARVAELVVRVPGMPDQRTPLIAAEAVAEAGFLRRAWLGLMTVFGA